MQVKCHAGQVRCRSSAISAMQVKCDAGQVPCRSSAMQVKCHAGQVRCWSSAMQCKCHAVQKSIMATPIDYTSQKSDHGVPADISESISG